MKARGPLATFIAIGIWIPAFPFIVAGAILGVAAAFVWGGIRRGWELGYRLDNETDEPL